MKRGVRIAIAVAAAVLAAEIVYLAVLVARESVRDEAQPADVILVLGAAEYRGRPSPVFKARLDHALDLYYRQLAPRIMTTGGAGRTYLVGRGVPSEAVIAETESESTLESTAMAGEIMNRMGLRSVIAVTD